MNNDLQIMWGERLQRFRMERGLSLRALAKKAGVDHGHLWKAEQGEAGLGDDARVRIATALEREVADVFPYPPVKEAS